MRRSDRAAAALGTDQWALKEGSVRLVALWLSGRPCSNVGFEVQRHWYLKFEANPKRRSKDCEAEGDHERARGGRRQGQGELSKNVLSKKNKAETHKELRSDINQSKKGAVQKEEGRSLVTTRRSR